VDDTRSCSAHNLSGRAQDLMLQTLLQRRIGLAVVARPLVGCLAWRGETIVDFTWANPAASGRITRWEASAGETLSDHLYIVMDVTVCGAGGDRSFGSCGPEGSYGRRRRNFQRWPATHRDEDLTTSAAMAVVWAEEPPADEETETGTASMRRDLHAICDSCVPRSGTPRRASAVYWWFEEITHLREACIRARRRYTQSRRRRRGHEAAVAYLYDSYREARRPLKRAIKEAN
jgi:hypothetical protein